MHAVGEAPAGAPSAEDALAAVRGRLHRASEVARSNAKRLWIAAKEVHARLLAERDPAAEGAEPSDGLDGEPARALVVGVCGMSCSGKSTVVAGLRAHASQLGSSPLQGKKPAFLRQSFPLRGPLPHGLVQVRYLHILDRHG